MASWHGAIALLLSHGGLPSGKSRHPAKFLSSHSFLASTYSSRESSAINPEGCSPSPRSPGFQWQGRPFSASPLLTSSGSDSWPHPASLTTVLLASKTMLSQAFSSHPSYSNDLAPTYVCSALGSLRTLPPHPPPLLLLPLPCLGLSKMEDSPPHLLQPRLCS